jgi:uncharacterized protein (TIGR02145 family)
MLRVRLLTNVILLLVFLALGTRSIAQIQTYHNGFVVATNNGVYYLMDGDDQWLSLGGLKYINAPLDVTFNDTVFGVSFKDNLFCSATINHDGDRQCFAQRKYGYKNNEINGYGSGGVIRSQMFKNITSKLKYKNSFYLVSKISLTGNNVSVSEYNSSGGGGGQTMNIDPTSLSSDNDSTIVIVGVDNSIFKVVLNESSIYSFTPISGLTSSASSGHQICYDSNDDLFWIVSDEGKLYSYDKSTVTYIKQLPTSGYSESIVDSVTDIAYSRVWNGVIVACRNADDHFSVYVENGASWSQIYSGYGYNPTLSENNKGEILVSCSLGEYKITGVDGSYTDVADLPSGVVVYDLDYIDYLPYVAPPPVIIGGEEYETITIGTQTWLKRNLHYNDSGGEIYSYANNTANSDIYGYLYTWDAAMRVDTLIEGWHLASDAEWTILTTYLGGTSVAGGKIKEVGYTHWTSPNTGATNSSEFTGLPAGIRSAAGVFSNISTAGYWWSSTPLTTTAWNRNVSYTLSSIARSGSQLKGSGYSVRLIKD